MTYKCNGCGADMDGLTAGFVYGDAMTVEGPDNMYSGAVGQHLRTFCPKCTVVVKDILLNSDLSDHWHKYDFDSDDQTT